MKILRNEVFFKGRSDYRSAPFCGKIGEGKQS